MLYDLPTFVIALALLASLFLTMIVGRKMGVRSGRDLSDEAKGQIGAVQGSLLGILALLLGFTFSLSLSRFDARSDAVVTEANAIGTAWLRTEFLPEALRATAQADMRRYLELRIAASEVALPQQGLREERIAAAEAVFADLWHLAAGHARDSGGAVAASYAASLNDMIDALGSRDAVLNRHVPDLVLYLMFVTLVLSIGLMGYTAGVARNRVVLPMNAMLVLVVLVVFLIIDLDRPRRGLIEVSQAPLQSLLVSMGPAVVTPGGPKGR